MHVPCERRIAVAEHEDSSATSMGRATAVARVACAIVTPVLFVLLFILGRPVRCGAVVWSKQGRLAAPIALLRLAPRSLLQVYWSLASQRMHLGASGQPRAGVQTCIVYASHVTHLLLHRAGCQHCSERASA